MFHRKSSQAGFTVIELTLAMAFLAFILIFTTTTTVQMMRTYNKGLTIKQINQAGRSLTEDLARALSAGSASDVNIAYVNQGKLCIGNASYMWNPVYSSDASHTFNNGGITNHRWSDGTSISLVRAQKSLCRVGAAETLPPADENNFSLLSEQARVLDVSVDQNTDKKLVRLTFTIGTYDAVEEPSLEATPAPLYNSIYNTPYYSGGNLTCRPGGGGNFCSFSTFSTTVYVGN